MKKQYLFFLFLAITLSSCSKVYYQVYSTKSSNVRDNGTELAYENNEVKVTYNLWSKGGNPGFTIFNKTKYDLYVILPNSFFVKNEKAYDYFLNRELSSDTQHTVTRGTLGGVTSSSKTNSGVVYHEKPIICIPAGTSKIFSEYKIHDSYFDDDDRNINFPKTRSASKKFNRRTSPVVFKNRITYSYHKDGKESKSIENEFYVSEIVNYSKKEIGEEIESGGQSDYKNMIHVFKASKPHQFYNTYTNADAKK